ncbi:unnamed protein product [Acanthoscelides obtectus]|uniref:Rab-GAP TBC domain-containing protein n=1 Tax=Acanthoscelides obtectus TaxID=200917 RepID=A0A9P0M5A7_ACAOB|nr:unnamed protein product [Acanthoscelides obtectus]CAK1636207.1 TBC1 domain family member 12 [Acanthoscelides obtectus]
MKSFEFDRDAEELSENSSQVKDLLIDKNLSKKSQLTKLNNIYSSENRTQGYQYVSTEDVRSISLPDCAADKSNGTSCNNQKKQNEHGNNLSLIATTEAWFKTWPERCDKIKTNETSPTKTSPSKTTKHCCPHQPENGSPTRTKFTLNEALQNISLAYSPITKQLHLVEKTDSVKEEFEPRLSSPDDSCSIKKSGHKRTEAGSFSSTVSTLSAISEPSTSGSLLDSDDRSVSSFDTSGTKPRKKSLTNFFSKHVFSWKTPDVTTSNPVWKLFGKSSNYASSPIHHVASSSALIQLERPSTLPAKTQEEDQRHRDEYKAILLAAKRKEAQTNAAKHKQQKLQLKLEEQQAAATKHFTQHVLPYWEVMRTNRKTVELWWQGLPSSVRGRVWKLAIGNELNVTAQLYEICLLRAQNRLNNTASPDATPDCDSNGQSDESGDPESSMDAIRLDISRTFPHLGIFQEGGPYSETLHSLLAAYVCYRPDVGYVQGMSYIAAILILNMEQYDAFICFANLLNQPLHLSAFTLNQRHMQAYYDAYNQVFSYNLPRLYSHFESSGLTPDLYLLDWIYTIFAKAMPLDVACRVWDVFLRDGYEFIFRTALGILHLNQESLMTMDFLHGAQFLTRLPDDLSSDLLFKSIQSVNTTIGKRTFTQIVDKCLFSLVANLPQQDDT